MTAEHRLRLIRAYFFFDGAACALFGFYGATASFSEAVKALIVANHFLETALENFRAAVSAGYARGKLSEKLPRDRKDWYDSELATLGAVDASMGSRLLSPLEARVRARKHQAGVRASP